MTPANNNMTLVQAVNLANPKFCNFKTGHSNKQAITKATSTGMIKEPTKYNDATNAINKRNNVTEWGSENLRSYQDFKNSSNSGNERGADYDD